MHHVLYRNTSEQNHVYTQYKIIEDFQDNELRQISIKDKYLKVKYTLEFGTLHLNSHYFTIQKFFLDIIWEYTETNKSQYILKHLTVLLVVISNDSTLCSSYLTVTTHQIKCDSNYCEK